MATIAGNHRPDYECSTYQKAVAVLMNYEAGRKQEGEE